MAKQRIILLVAVCFSLALLAAQPPSYTPPRFPPRKPGMSREEHQKEMEKAIEQYRQQNLKRIEEYGSLMGKEAWKHLLRVTDAQWKLIEPEYEAVATLLREAHVCALGFGGEESFSWHKHSEGGGSSAKTLDEMTEGEKIVDELIDLLEDANSTDEQIKKKIDALHQARENARKALPKAKQELAAVLTTPRQEAVFLIRGYID